jgi:hypothetical protein
MGTLADWAAVLIVVGAAAVSVRSLVLSNRHNEDVGSGTFAMQYREHVWFLHNPGLSQEQIETALRRESSRPGMPITDRDNASDGCDGRGGLWRELGTVSEIFDAPIQEPQSATH